MSVENAQRLGSVLTFRNVSYTVSVREKGCSPREKKIIKNISGIMRPGMNAIMGPTGSGKTTYLYLCFALLLEVIYTTNCLCFRLMDILAKRADVGQLSGEVEIDGRHPPRNFKCMSGYVVQV
jgi:ATP-binding cassette subfamily G (WHITE) protein 2